MKKVICVFLAVLLLTSILGGCAKSNVDKTAEGGDSTKNAETVKTEPATEESTPVKKEPVELVYWTNQVDRQDMIDEQVSLWSEKNPEIKIKITMLQVMNMRQTIKPALASNSGPDFIYGEPGPGYMGVLAKAGLLLEMDDFSKKFDWPSKISADALKDATIEGKLYGISTEIFFCNMYYNKKIFNELGVAEPKTWDEFINICEKAKAKGYIPISIDDKDQWPGFHYEAIMFNAVAGKQKMKDVLEGKATWDQPVFAEALDLLQGFVKKGYTTKSPNSIANADGSKEFMSGKAAMRMTGTWKIPAYEEGLGIENVGIFLLPPYKEEVDALAPAGFGACWIINKKTKYPEESAKFIDYMFSEEIAKSWVKTAGFIQPLKMDYSKIGISDTMIRACEIATDANGIGYNLDTIMPQTVNTATQNYIQGILDGSMTAKKAVKIKADAMKEAVDKGEYQYTN